MLLSQFFSDLQKIRLLGLLRRGLKISLLMGLVLFLVFSWAHGAAWAADRVSRLPAGNAITDGKALLRYALPIDNGLIRDVQISLEDISNQLRGKRWTAVTKDVAKVAGILRDHQTDLVNSVAPAQQPQAQALISELQAGIGTLQTAIEAKDKPAIAVERSKLLDRVGALEELMVQKFPFPVPAAYSNLPQLKGRATIAIETSKGPLTVVVDGYSAPVTAGNFVDLVNRGFYNGLKFIRAEESYVLQFGDPDGPEQGFVDPKTGQYRAIPLEVLVRGDSEPTYGITLEDAGRYRDQPVLPFSSYGALALARPGDDPNGGSSQVFFFLFEPELTPAGLNLLDGRYAVFGYLTEGRDVLEKLKEGDKIESAKVIQGLENLA
ncbi:peptidylprolyl isomerase [Leptolyngbya sp. 'hensonii']|uniref:peptidylprolyl isomerase n=1 Tax=Leptolyngbya sp. 'hensonii' TaxID=1922337 RepID=UPI00094FBA93|nr:peptidylprolyl isomerase [Leptolyngbya sp. 'hensonii']OLP19382.1 peptidylprolyl isomerase [Leptolyngbya sp. 'hensonii']